MKTLGFALLLSAALPLAADPLGDVRAALAKLTARDPIKATVEIDRSTKNDGRFGNENQVGKLAVDVEGDANGFRIGIPRPLMDQIGREAQARARNPKAPSPGIHALRELEFLEMMDAVDTASGLQRLLEGAKVISETSGTWQGKPVRVMVLRAADRDDGEGKEKITENRVTLWLGPDHVPVAAEHLFALKISVLLLKGELKSKKSWHLAQAGDRLVRMRYEETQSASGLGQKQNEQVVATLRLR